MAARLNRQELNRIRSGGGYYRGYSVLVGVLSAATAIPGSQTGFVLLG